MVVTTGGGEGYYWQLVGLRVQGCCETPYDAQDGPRSKELSGPNVSCAEAETPFAGGDRTRVGSAGTPFRFVAPWSNDCDAPAHVSPSYEVRGLDSRSLSSFPTRVFILSSQAADQPPAALFFLLGATWQVGALGRGGHCTCLVLSPPPTGCCYQSPAGLGFPSPIVGDVRSHRISPKEPTPGRKGSHQQAPRTRRLRAGSWTDRAAPSLLSLKPSLFSDSK